MSRKLFFLGLCGQILFLVAFYGWHAVQVASGTRIRLRVVQPVDPVSIVRGRYLNLAYSISSVPSTGWKAGWKEGDTAYVSVRQKGDFWEFSGIHRKPPGGLFLTGRVGWASPETVSIAYGIEHFFLSEESANLIEKARGTQQGWQARERAQDEFMRRRLTEMEWRVYELTYSGRTREHIETVLREIEAWKEEGILPAEKAKELKRRYEEAWKKIQKLLPQAALETEPASRPSLAVEVSVTPSGKAYLRKLFYEGSEYR